MSITSGLLCAQHGARGLEGHNEQLDVRPRKRIRAPDAAWAPAVTGSEREGGHVHDASYVGR